MRCESSRRGGLRDGGCEATHRWVTSAHAVITVQVIFRRAPLNIHLTLRHYSSLKQPEVNGNQKRFKAHLSPEFSAYLLSCSQNSSVTLTIKITDVFVRDYIYHGFKFS